MEQEHIDLIRHCKWKGYITDEDADVIWMHYDEIFGKFAGCLTCNDNRQMALKQLIIWLNEQGL